MLIKVLEAAKEIQSFCQTKGWKFCFIGGVAVQRWGDPRLTQDADLTLLSGFGEEESFITPLLEHYQARMPDAHKFALRNRVLLLTMPNGVPVDIGLGGLPFEQHSIERASEGQITKDYSLITCCAEDLIVHKAFANRAQDWLDIETILMRQREKLKMRLVWEELEPLVELKEEPAILDHLRQLEKEILSVKNLPKLNRRART